MVETLLCGGGSVGLTALALACGRGQGQKRGEKERGEMHVGDRDAVINERMRVETEEEIVNGECRAAGSASYMTC